ncbi:MAG: hypothetical protein ACLPXW_08410 [Xanthobacteraceae bacterium]
MTVAYAERRNVRKREREVRHREVSHRLTAVDQSFDALDRHYLPPALIKVMTEAHVALGSGDFDKAVHLAAVAECIVRREVAQFAKDPKAWKSRREFVASELRA